jgi:hypothetical protein
MPKVVLTHQKLSAILSMALRKVVAIAGFFRKMGCIIAFSSAPSKSEAPLQATRGGNAICHYASVIAVTVAIITLVTDDR